MAGWVYDPHSGGVKIPERTKAATRERILKHAETHHAGKYDRIDVRFRGVFCYIDAYVKPTEPDEALLKAIGETREEFLERMESCPLHLCRLRHFTANEWSLGYYSYATDAYEPSFFPNDTFIGTPEAGFEVGAMNLTD